MASMNFTDYKPKSTGNFPERSVGYFNSLKNDGDEAIVRLNYETKADFKVVTVHRVKVGDFYRNVSCLKGAYDTADVCPLCAKGNKVLTKVFVSLIDYTKDDAGKVVATPKVWERPVGFVQDILDALKDALDDGFVTPTTKINDVVFKVRRSGEKGSIDTKYRIKVCNPSVFPESIYVKDFSAFEGFDMAHHSYSNKTAEEMKTFIETGKFPERVKETKPAQKEEPKPEVPAKEELPVHPGVAESVAVFETPAAGTPATTTNKPHRYAF